MATKPANKAAPKTAAPAKTAAKAPAAKKAAAPAPAPVEEVAEEGGIDVGTVISFVGYGEDVPEDQQFLAAGEQYTIAGFTEPQGNEGDEDYDAGGDPYVEIENPDFNAKKKETADNPKVIAIPVYEGEYEVVAEGEEGEVEGEGEGEGEAAEEVAAPAPAAPKAGKAVGKAKAADKAAAPAKGKKAAAPAAEEAAEESDELPELEGEDEEVLALVSGDRNLIEVAQELEAAAATNEYRLGGVLRHIKKDKSYLELEDGQKYAEKGGFELFVQDYFNIEYRKAMYLIQIYEAFTIARIENPAEAVARMGWTKASKIAAPILDNPETAGDLVELAEQHTVADLTVAIKEQVTVGGTKDGGTKITRTTLKFRLEEQQGAFVQQTLEAVASAQGLKDIAEALNYVVTEFAAANMPAGATAAPKATKAVGKAPAAKPAAKSAPAKKAAAK